MRKLEKIAKIADELENQLGIVNEVEQNAEDAIENGDAPEQALEADEDVTVSLEDGNGEVIAEECPECGQEPCVCEKPEAPVAEEEVEEPLTVEQMAEVSERIGKVAKKVRASKALTASQKDEIIGKLAKFASKKEAADDENDPKYLQIVAALKAFSSKYNSMKTKPVGKLLGITSLSGVTLEGLFDALYVLATRASK